MSSAIVMRLMQTLVLHAPVRDADTRTSTAQVSVEVLLDGAVCPLLVTMSLPDALLQRCSTSELALVWEGLRLSSTAQLQGALDAFAADGRLGVPTPAHLAQAAVKMGNDPWVPWVALDPDIL